MTELEFLNTKKELENQHLQRMKELEKTFAIQGNKIRVGMVITDIESTIIVDSISAYVRPGYYPILMFSGKTRNSDGSLMKYPKDDHIFKSSSIKIIT